MNEVPARFPVPMTTKVSNASFTSNFVNLLLSCDPVRRSGWVTSAEGQSRIPDNMSVFISKTLSVHPAVNGYSAVFRAREREGSEEEQWRPTLVTPLPAQQPPPHMASA